MTYYGAQKIITNYNVMGVAKAALEASVRYLSVDLGAKDVRINAISAAPSRRWLPLAFPTSSRSSITLKNTPPSAAT